MTNLSARSLRHYEDKGLLTATFRGSNGYRYYDEDTIKRIKEIKKLKKMDFSLNEIKEFLNFQENNLKISLKSSLEKKVAGIDQEILRLKKSKREVENQLLATNQFLDGNQLEKDQRRILMDVIKSEILSKLKNRKSVTRKDLEYLKREDYLINSEEKREFIKAIEKCLNFAKSEKIKLGPARGSAPALLSLYALGWSDFDPSYMGLVPERFSATDFNLHIDVEFKKGKKFIDFCKSVSSNLKIGKIEAFKLPIIDN